MFYAEKIDGPFGTPEKGIFFSIEEFAPYRALGWESQPENNALADELLRRESQQERT